jgi:mRNA interferase HicA
MDRMKGAEFVRKIKKLGRKRKVEVAFVAERGKGSHGTLYYGHTFIVVKDLKKELGIALLHAMLVQLGLSRDDLN